MSMFNDLFNNVFVGKCFFYVEMLKQSVGSGIVNCDWWLNQLCVDLLNQYFNCFNLLGENFNYREEFKKFDYFVLKVDFRVLLIDL